MQSVLEVAWKRGVPQTLAYYLSEHLSQRVDVTTRCYTQLECRRQCVMMIHHANALWRNNDVFVLRVACVVSVCCHFYVVLLLTSHRFQFLHRRIICTFIYFACAVALWTSVNAQFKTIKENDLKTALRWQNLSLYYLLNDNCSIALCIRWWRGDATWWRCKLILSRTEFGGSMVMI